MKWVKWFTRRKPVVHRKIVGNESSLNDLSNELFFEIFDYFSYEELLFSFGHLNEYFTQLLNYYPHRIHLQTDHHPPKYIRSLKISARHQLPSFSSLQSTQFSSLRAMTLANLRPEQVMEILKIIPSKQLEYIYLGIWAFEGRDYSERMISVVQMEILRLSQYRLKQIRFKQTFSVEINDLPERLDALENLQLVACSNFFVLSELLARTPNLKSLHVSTMNIHGEPLIGKSFSLTSLCLRPHSNCTMEELGLFLEQCCSNLERLCVALYIHPGKQPGLAMNRDRWMQIFPPQLRSFHLKSLASSSVHLTNFYKEPMTSALREILHDHTHPCQILVDGPLIPIWNRNT